MQNRVKSVLMASITGVIIIAAPSVHATSNTDTGRFYRDSLNPSEQHRIENLEVPRSLSFRFASLYNRIKHTAARIAELAYLDGTAMNSLGLDVGFRSLERSDTSTQINADISRRLLPPIKEESRDGFSLRIDVSDDHAPLVDPSPRKPTDPLKDKIWLSLGARYHHSERLSLDIGYEHLWVNETTFDRPGGVGSDIMGDYRSELDLIGARLRWSFD